MLSTCIIATLTWNSRHTITNEDTVHWMYRIFHTVARYHIPEGDQLRINNIKVLQVLCLCIIGWCVWCVHFWNLWRGASSNNLSHLGVIHPKCALKMPLKKWVILRTSSAYSYSKLHSLPDPYSQPSANIYSQVWHFLLLFFIIFLYLLKRSSDNDTSVGLVSIRRQWTRTQFYGASG